MTDFWHRKVGLTDDEVGALTEGAEVHCKTTTGCEVLKVMGPPKLVDGYWEARAASRAIGSFRINRIRTQFHTPGEQCHYYADREIHG